MHKKTNQPSGVLSFGWLWGVLMVRNTHTMSKSHGCAFLPPSDHLHAAHKFASLETHLLTFRHLQSAKFTPS